MSECIFCRIIAGDILANKVYESEAVIAFLAINPVSRGHTLVVPKNHARDVFDVSDDDLCEVIATAKRIAQAAEKALGADGVNILHASGETAQQSVFHLHFHVVPRYKGDGIDAWPHSKYGEKDLDKVADELRGAL